MVTFSADALGPQFLLSDNYFLAKDLYKKKIVVIFVQTGSFYTCIE